MSVEVLQNWVMQTGLMVSLLIVIILVIRRPFARMFGANAAYALWSLPLIRLCFPVVSIPSQWIPEGLRPEKILVQDIGAAGDAASRIHTNEITSGVFPAPEAATVPWTSIFAFALMLWASIAVLWLGFQLLQQYQFKSRLLDESEALPDSLAADAARIAQRMGFKKTPHVRLSTRDLGPLVSGVISPVVILPKSFEEDFDTEQRGFALTHEFAHLKRKDLWVAFTALVFRAVNWPNPLVHFAAHRLRADQEAACDAYVVRMMDGEAVHSYAETLVKAAKQSIGEQPAQGQLALSLMDNEISKGD